MSHLVLIFVLVPFFFFATVSFAKALELNEVIQAAITTNKSLQATKTLTEKSSFELDAISGQLYPQIGASASNTWFDPSNKQLDQSQTSVKLYLTQPLFHGLREWAIKRSKSAEHESRIFQEESEKLKITVEVMQVFYQHLISEREIVNFQSMQKLSQERLQLLRKRVTIGRSRKSELNAAVAQLSSLQTQMEISIGEKTKTEEQLRFLTGLENLTIQDLNWEKDFELPRREDLKRSIEGNKELKVREFKVKAKEEDISAAKALHYPSLDLTGNYYLKREGVLEGSRWDISLVFNLPLYTGGSTHANVQAAVAQHRAESLDLEHGRNRIMQEIFSMYELLMSQLKQIKQVEKTLELFKENYDEQSRDFNLGLVNSLDVNQALNSLYETSRLRDKLRLNARANLHALNMILGKTL